MCTHPVLNLLLLDVHGGPLVIGAEYLVGGVIDAPDQIGEWVAGESGAVCQGAYVFPDHFGRVLVVLEFQPFGFGWLLGKFIHQ